MDAYRDAFRGFVSRFPPDGVIVANAADREVVDVCAKAPCRVVYYALAGRETFMDPTWVAAPIAPSRGVQPFELFVGGARVGIATSPLMGEHNVANATAALVLLTEAVSLPTEM